MDKRIGNTEGLGGVFAFLKAIGSPLPVPEAQRLYTPSLRFEAFERVGKAVGKAALAHIPWPADFDQYGTYLYGECSPADGRYTMHRSLRGNMPQWGLEHKPLLGLARLNLALPREPSGLHVLGVGDTSLAAFNPAPQAVELVLLHCDPRRDA